jgi:hypothetical protein
MARHKVIINRWYVFVQAPNEWRANSSRAPFPRMTKGFPTEVEAKQFAKAMLSDGLKVIAGTLSPHQPARRYISTSEIGQ